MAQLPRTLAARLPEGMLRLGRAVTRLERTGNGWCAETATETLRADAVCLAVPAYLAARLLGPVDPALARELEAIEYASTATVTLAYRRDRVAHPLDGFGFVVPAVERRATLACTFASVKFPGRAPAGSVLLRAFVGGALAPRDFEMGDAEMTAAVERDLTELLGVRGAPLWTLVARWPRSMPQYHVGHIARVRRIDDAVADTPGLALAGNAYTGAGIPDTVRNANAAAQRIAEMLGLGAAPLRRAEARRA
jgi:oxygen-dependent protoporphyrinogen oxidase